MPKQVVAKSMPTEGTLPLIFRPLPQLDGSVRTAAGQETFVRAEGNRFDLTFMAGKGLKQFPVLRVYLSQ